jgi:hypothetical protein
MSPRLHHREQRSASVGSPTTKTMTGALVSIRVDLLELGRHLELDPHRWPDAQAAFRLATRVADVTRMEALR